MPVRSPAFGCVHPRSTWISVYGLPKELTRAPAICAFATPSSASASATTIERDRADSMARWSVGNSARASRAAEKAPRAAMTAKARHFVMRDTLLDPGDAWMLQDATTPFRIVLNAN